MTVVAGEWNRSASNEVRTIIDVSLIKMHEKYVFPDNDIALLKLATPITFNENVQPVCAPDSSVDYTYRKVLTSGWGVIRSGKLMCYDLFHRFISFILLLSMWSALSLDNGRIIGKSLNTSRSLMGC